MSYAKIHFPVVPQTTKIRPQMNCVGMQIRKLSQQLTPPLPHPPPGPEKTYCFWFHRIPLSTCLLFNHFEFYL